MKKLLVLPLAAILCGTLCHPPRLKPELLTAPGRDCLERAKNDYLLAYAYRIDDETKSRGLTRKALEKLSQCPNPELIQRINELKKSFP